MSQSSITNYALISVFDKEGLQTIANAFIQKGYALLATGGTFTALKGFGFEVTEVADLTGEPERFGGRLKTLHHKILGAILFRPGKDEPEWPFGFRIGAVVCNFYPFVEKAQLIRKPEELIEWIDIGGPNMVRAAAKNYQHCWVLTKPSQYTRLIASLDDDGNLKARLALEAFDLVREYNDVVSDEMDFLINQQGIYNQQVQTSRLRYGENPQQEARFYPNKKLGLNLFGEWSYNNVRDADAAFRFLRPWENNPAVCVIKHQTLCGASVSLDLAANVEAQDEVFQYAWEGDTVSRYGGVLGFNFFPSHRVLQELESKFIEVLLLPKSEESQEWAKRVCAQKPRLKVALVNPDSFKVGSDRPTEEMRLSFGKLVQTSDYLEVSRNEKSLSDFGVWTAACVKSNAITLVGKKGTLVFLAGAGGGQPNRVDCLDLLAIPRAKDFCKRMQSDFTSLECFSDAFLPFDDLIRVCAKNGIKSITHPGGSKNDEANIVTAKSLGVDLKQRAPRHFWH
jgi:phosphoribosylaminoimidazolecarboxamide formyltransferase/IMP cyclohydrolase